MPNNQLNQNIQDQLFAQHEKLDVHEYLAFKNVCAAKAAAMSRLAKDPELKALLEDDLRITQNQIREMETFFPRNVLKRHLAEAMDNYEKATNYMMNKDWYPAYNVDQLIQMDLQTSQKF